MQWEISSWLLFPVILSVLFGRMEVMTKMAKGTWFTIALVAAALTVLWSVIGYALPIFYVLVYLCRVTSLVAGQSKHRRSWFMLNLGFANTLALHMIFIGAAALCQGVTMRALLMDSFWRVMSVSAVLAISSLENFCFFHWPTFSVFLNAEAESEEGRPFMAFLWFCTGYLLLDSMLCVFELEPLYPPLFLIGSSIVLMFVLIRFLLHISMVIWNNFWKDEHDRLASRLEATQEHACALKHLADRDALTDVFSRRYAMEHIDALVEAQNAFSLVFLDMDALKQINDREGHEAGDRYLIRFTQALGERLREGDLLARVGGDEFLVLLPDCDPAMARARMEKIRSALQAAPTGGFRFSFGVTALRPGGKEDAASLIQEADRAMYQDKVRRRKEGRL